MGTRFIPPEFITVLKLLLTGLAEVEFPWVLTGSLAFAIQKIPLIPEDIDLQTDRRGAYEIEKIFSCYQEQPVVLSERAGLRSHVGVLRIQGVRVEIIGDLEKRGTDRKWRAPPDLEELRTHVSYAGVEVPVLPLWVEAGAYEQMGRQRRAELLFRHARSAESPVRPEAAELFSGGMFSQPILERHL